MSDSFEITNNRLNIKCKFYHDKSLFYYNGKPKYFKNRAHSNIICELISVYPDCINGDKILNIMHRINLGNTEDDPSKVAAREILKIRNHLKNTDKYIDIIETIRGSGYKISEEWILTEENSNQEHDIESLLKIRNIVDTCKTFCIDERIIYHNSGIVSINKNEINFQILFEESQKLLWDLIIQESKPSTRPLVFKLKSECWELLSYITFWRFGEKHRPEDWIEEYCAEIEACYESITLLIERIRASD